MTKNDLEMAEIYDRHTTIKTLFEAKEVFFQLFSELTETQKVPVRQALLTLIKSAGDDALRKQLCVALCVGIGGGHLLPPPPPKKRKDPLANF